MRVVPGILAAIAVAAASASFVSGHPVPDIPVRSSFEADGKGIVRVEIDPRCFAEDPLNEPYLENSVFQKFDESRRAVLKEKAAGLIAKMIEFRLHPGGKINPDFRMKFTTFDNEPLKWNAEDSSTNTAECGKRPVMITAEWSLDTSEAEGYQIAASEAAKFSIQFINFVAKQPQRLHVLFPGEESYVLPLASGGETGKKSP